MAHKICWQHSRASLAEAFQTTAQESIPSPKEKTGKTREDWTTARPKPSRPNSKPCTPRPASEAWGIILPINQFQRPMNHMFGLYCFFFNFLNYIFILLTSYVWGCMPWCTCGGMSLFSPSAMWVLGLKPESSAIKFGGRLFYPPLPPHNDVYHGDKFMRTCFLHYFSCSHEKYLRKLFKKGLVHRLRGVIHHSTQVLAARTRSTWPHYVHSQESQEMNVTTQQASSFFLFHSVWNHSPWDGITYIQGWFFALS